MRIVYPVLQLFAKPEEGCKEYPKGATESLRAKRHFQRLGRYVF